MISQKTSHTLLNKMMDPDDNDWDRFYSVYSNGILAYARSCGCNKAQAEDILQETMVLLINKLRSFEYDPTKGTFRGYLRRIVQRKIFRHFERLKRRGENRLSTEWEQSMVDPDSLADPDSDKVHWRKLLVVTALQQIENEYQQNNWSRYEIFEDYVLRKVPAAEVAEKHGVTPNNVYQIRKRILNRLRAIIEHLEQSGIDSLEEVPPMNPDDK